MARISNTFVEIRKMKSDEYFERSKNPQKKPERLQGQMTLQRRGLMDDNWNFVEDQVRSSVMSGEVWGMRGIGGITIRKLCDWLEEQDEKDEAKK